MNIKTVFCAIMALGSLVGQAQKDPLREVVRGYSEELSFNAIVTLRQNVDEPEILQIQFAKGRDMKMTILQPSVSAGFAFIDDYKTLRIYDPASKSVIVRQSPVVHMLKPAQQMELMKKNYELKRSRTSRYLGREVYVVELEAKSEEMYDRKLYVDRKFPLLLRSEGRKSTGGTKVFMEVINIKELSKQPDKFTFNTTRDWRLRNMRATATIDQVKLISGILGYTPKRGVKLKYGLQEFAGYVVETSKGPILARKISDGVSIVTIFEWDTNKSEKVGTLEPAYLAGSIGFKGVGDAPDSVITAMERAYAYAQAGRGQVTQWSVFGQK